jgi:hypothetical protein
MVAGVDVNHFSISTFSFPTSISSSLTKGICLTMLTNQNLFHAVPFEALVSDWLKGVAVTRVSNGSGSSSLDLLDND